MKIPWNYLGIIMFLFIFLENNFKEFWPGFSYLFEMLSRQWCHTEICLGYTKLYALEK